MGKFAHQDGVLVAALVQKHYYMYATNLTSCLMDEGGAETLLHV